MFPSAAPTLTGAQLGARIQTTGRQTALDIASGCVCWEALLQVRVYHNWVGAARIVREELIGAVSGSQIGAPRASTDTALPPPALQGTPGARPTARSRASTPRRRRRCLRSWGWGSARRSRCFSRPGRWLDRRARNEHTSRGRPRSGREEAPALETPPISVTIAVSSVSIRLLPTAITDRTERYAWLEENVEIDAEGQLAPRSC